MYMEISQTFIYLSTINCLLIFLYKKFKIINKCREDWIIVLMHLHALILRIISCTYIQFNCVMY